MDSEARDPVSGDIIPMSRDPVSIHIDQMREWRRPICTVSEFIICRVPRRLRCLNEAAYEPQLLSIGPYNHGKPHLIAMQVCKVLCLDKILKRLGHDVEMYVKALRELEEEARESYEEPVEMDKDEFVEMLLLDGCFIVELISRQGDLDDDLASLVRYNLSGIRRDMLLLENQLPFTVLEKLFSLCKDPQEERELVPQVLQYFDQTVAGMYTKAKPYLDPRTTHLLGVVHHHLDLLPLELGEHVVTGERQLSFAIKLKEAGIKFTDTLSRLRFEGGILNIPPLIICEEYESTLRNLIAYEQFLVDDSSHRVINFAVVMQHLIAAPKDVELLRSRGIVPIGRGQYDSDTQIVHLFQTLLQGVELKWHNLDHLYILNDAMEYGSRRRTKWKAKCKGWMQKLWDDYFSSPWAFISVMAACILLVLTFLQTYYSILSYKK